MKLHKFDCIVALYIFGIAATQLMGVKTIPFGNLFGLPLSISVAVFLMPLLFTITDVVVEVYGKARARSLVWIGLGIVVLLTLYTLLVTNLPTSERYAASNDAYNTVFGTSVRFALASIAAFLGAENIDVLIYTKLRERTKKKGMWLRNNLSNFIGQLVDSMIFVTIAFYIFDANFGTNLVFLAGIILPYWIIRCGMSIVGTPLAYAGVALLRRRETAKPQLQSEVTS